jgi:hypothetical protein
VEEIRDPSRRATLEEIDKAENLLIIGDILERTPVLSKRINRVKYGKRGNKIIVVDPADTRTTWFATTHLRSLGNVMEGFNGVIIIVPGLEGSVVAAAQRVESAQYMVYYLGGNQLGVCQTLKERRGDTAGCKVFLSMEPNFSCRTAEHEILLPLASQFEAGGSFTLSGGREVKSEPIAPRVGTKTVAEIMTLIYG